MNTLSPQANALARMDAASNGNNAIHSAIGSVSKNIGLDRNGLPNNNNNLDQLFNFTQPNTVNSLREAQLSDLVATEGEQGSFFFGSGTSSSSSKDDPLAYIDADKRTRGNEEAWQQGGATLDKILANRINADGSINPHVLDNFSDFNFRDDLGKQFKDYFGFDNFDQALDQLDRIQNNNGDDGVPDALIHDFQKEGGDFKNTLQEWGMEGEQNIKNLWDRTSEINGYLFKEDSGKFGEAANKTLEKFGEAGLQDLFTDFGNSVHDQGEVLAHAMKNNISVEGIKDFGDVYGAYLKNRDNVVNAGLVNREAYEHYQNTGELRPGADYGNMELSDEEFKGLVNDLNEDMMKDTTKAMGYDVEAVREELRNNGVTAMNNYDGSLFSAMGIASLMSKKGSDGQTGFDKLVQKSQERDGADSSKRYDAATNLFTMNDSVSRDTDGTAFSRSEAGNLGLDALSSLHSKGLNDNPFSPNTFALGIQGAADANTAKKYDDQMTAMSNAGIDHKVVNYMISGHGSESGNKGYGGILLKSETSSGDSGLYTKDDADKMGKVIAKHIKDEGTVNITCDACETDELAEYTAQKVSEEAKKLGKDIEVNWKGSEEYGLVSAHQLGEKTNGDTRTMVTKDGAQYTHRLRGDHNGGNTRKGSLYSQSKSSFIAKAKQTKEENLAKQAESPAASDIDSSSEANGESKDTEIAQTKTSEQTDKPAPQSNPKPQREDQERDSVIS